MARMHNPGHSGPPNPGGGLPADGKARCPVCGDEMGPRALPHHISDAHGVDADE